MGKTKAVYHSFYCLNCGREGIPLGRKKSMQHEKFHRKRLYCPWCKASVNHIEVRSQDELDEFMSEFNEGAFQNEAIESMQHCVENASLFF